MTSTDSEAELALRESLSDEQVTELMADDMLPEYDVDYSKVKPNRFARREAVPEMVRFDADVAAVFQTSEAVNAVLRALIQSMPLLLTARRLDAVLEPVKLYRSEL